MMTEFLPNVITESKFNYDAVSDGVIICRCHAEIDETSVYIKVLERMNSDDDVLETLVKSVLNYAANHSKYMAYFCCENERDFAEKIGFIKGEDSFSNDIPSLFNYGCGKRTN